MRRVLFVFLTVLVVLFLSVWTSNAGTQVTLEWDAPTGNGAPTGYKVYYKTVGGAHPYDGTGAVEGNSPITIGNVTTFVFSDLADGTYYFVVTAFNDIGESDYSNEVSDTFLSTIPGSPLNLRIILKIVVTIENP